MGASPLLPTNMLLANPLNDNNSCTNRCCLARPLLQYGLHPEERYEDNNLVFIPLDPSTIINSN